ncbi:UNVERIFIED_ORG: hypothetical protein M2438_002503 [Methylobacterium sp. SuP10 SLI 274]|uniref:hypothetical protein n=1 Tax=Methylorubrum extorquens TaxID=408 RepID=UPI00209D4805|nr:hypothetical protein [Methylorubrum extorquens]MDF9863728.1 hypothetical protein [Methylorubrum pseudosasae]MDH6637328.1 hypothetical protein [Methylobacterium sp. SuP10 SLI 274]MDH6666508.1 hypothetical protein [Methylorubrum zatmanii]MCP1558419.1 hypothetical protein [Methylorubrum extorquens]MDF9792039.1 hypothetical protein [Methylorubrum extorquens]
MSVRKQIFRNINVAAINAGLRDGRFSLDIQPGEHSCRDDIPDWSLNEAGYEGHVTASHMGYGEINIRISLTKPCKLESSAWLERRDGKWLQIPERISSLFMSRVPRSMVGALLQNHVLPEGYKDSGPVKY